MVRFWIYIFLYPDRFFKSIQIFWLFLEKDKTQQKYGVFFMLNRSVKPFYIPRPEICHEQSYCSRHLPKLQQVWKKPPQFTHSLQRVAGAQLISPLFTSACSIPELLLTRLCMRSHPRRKMGRARKDTLTAGPLTALLAVASKTGDSYLLNSMRKQGL